MCYQLPKLVYIGDVRVEESFAGSTLLYRLLREYPADRLLILESNLQNPAGGRRLDGVRYETFTAGRPRLLRTRLHGAYGAFLTAAAGPWNARHLVNQCALLKAFQPEAVFTVGHGVSWRTADALARAAGIPLHLVVHDDWRVAVRGGNWAPRWVGRWFGDVYSRAAVRYCVSPYMQEAYAREFGGEGVVLLPMRGDDVPVYEQPKTPCGEQLTFAYAGNLYSDGYRELVMRLARALPENSRLLLFSPGVEAAIPESLRKRITVRETMPPAQLVQVLRDEANVLFCPSSFLPEERRAMGINLPSKLVEYTATGLPIFVWGPADSSAVKWARDHGEAALVATDPGDEALQPVLEQLRHWDVREHYAQRAIKVGKEQFTGVNVRQKFYRGLCRPDNDAVPNVVDPRSPVITR